MYICFKIFTLITYFLFSDFHAFALEKFWQFLCTFYRTPIQSEVTKYMKESRESGLKTERRKLFASVLVCE